MTDSRLMASAVGTFALVVLLVVLLVLLRAERRRAAAPKTADVASDLPIEPTLEASQGPDEAEREAEAEKEPDEAEGEGEAGWEVPAPTDSDEVRRTPRRLPGVRALILLPAARKRRPRGAPPTAESVRPAASDELIRYVQVADEPAVDEESRESEPAEVEGAATQDAAAFDHLLYRSRVDATCRAISKRIGAAEDPDTISARLGAAVDRLEIPVKFARPQLSPARAAAPGNDVAGVTPTRAPTVAPIADAPLIALTLSPDVAVAPENDVQPEVRVSGDVRSTAAPPADEDSERTPEAPVAEEEEVVVPVPPMAIDDNQPRRRSWRRGRHG